MKESEYQAALQKSRAIATEIPRCNQHIRQLERKVQSLLKEWMASPPPVTAKYFNEIEPDSVVGGATVVRSAAARQQENSGVGCPDCGSLMIFQEGCLLCRSCGYSKCG